MSLPLGLTPWRIDLRRQLKELAAQGITVLISSHILADLDDICTRVAMISGGKNATDAEGNSLIITLQARALRRTVYEVEVLGDAVQATQLVREISGVKVLEQHQNRMVLEVEGETPQAFQLLRRLVMEGIDVVQFARRVTTLEDRYQQAFGGKPQ